jgi:hypothetical protein
MRSFWLSLVICAVFTSGSLADERPPYLILRAPETPPHHDIHGYYAGRGYAVETQAYNYGWFGAKPGRQWNRALGYYRNYTQWKVK